MTKRAYKERFYPTSEQAELLAQTFGCVRFVYNSILRWRTDAFYQRQEKVGYVGANARLTELKKDELRVVGELLLTAVEAVTRASASRVAVVRLTHSSAVSAI